MAFLQPGLGGTKRKLSLSDSSSSGSSSSDNDVQIVENVTPLEDARHDHVVGICEGPSKAFNCCLQITSMSTLKMVGALLATLKKENTLEWNWELAEYTFDVTRVPDIIACLQAHVYLSNDDILHYTTQLKRLNDEEVEAVRAMAEEDAENEADGNSSEDWDDDLEMEELKTKQCIPGSFDDPFDRDEPDEEDAMAIQTSSSSSKPSSSNVPLFLTLSKKRKVKKCSEIDCDKMVYTEGKCWRHGEGGKICNELNCDKKVSRYGGKCSLHGKRCSELDCEMAAHRLGKCWRHGGGKRCTELNCEKLLQKDGKCQKHGPMCSTQDCDSTVKTGGKCQRHYEEDLCHIHGNPITRKVNGRCFRKSKKSKTEE